MNAQPWTHRTHSDAGRPSAASRFTAGLLRALREGRLRLGREYTYTRLLTAARCPRSQLIFLQLDMAAERSPLKLVATSGRTYRIELR